MALLLLILLGPCLLPGKALLPYDPRLHSPLQESLEPGHAAALLADSAGLFGDQVLQCLPFARFTRAELLQGRLPLWNPGLLGGIHHAAQGTGQVYYPLAWLGLLGDPLWLTPLLFAAHLLIGAWCLQRWLGVLGLDRRACLASALFWALSGWVWTNLHHPPIFQAGAWVFLGLWCLELLARRPQRPAALIGLAAATALSLSAGFPQVGILSVAVMAGYALLLAGLALRQKGARALTRLALPVLGAFGAGAALAAPQLLALADEAALAGRAPLPLEVMRAHALGPAHLLGSLLPELLAPLRGNPYGSLESMHPTYALLALDRRPPAVLGSLNAKETWLYLGLFPSLLALAALPRLRQPRVAFFVLLALFGLLAAAGLPPFLELWAGLGAGMGDPKRLLFFFALGGVCLAGLGLDRWLRMPRPGRLLGKLSLLLALCGALALAAGVLLQDKTILRFWLERVAPLFSAQIAPLAGERPWWEVLHEGILGLNPGEPEFNVDLTRRVLIRFGLAGLAAGLPLWIAGRSQRRWPILAVGLLLAMGDLGSTAWTMARPISWTRTDLISSWQALFPKDPGPGGEPLAPGRLLRLEAARRSTRPELLIPNLPALLEWEDAQGYVPLMPARMRDLFATLDPSLDLGGAGVHSLARIEQLEAPFLRLLRPSRLLCDIEVNTGPWSEKGRTPAGVRLYAAQELLPFAFTAPLSERVGRAELLHRLTRPGLDPTKRVLLEGEPGLEAPAEGLYAPARLLERRPGRIVLEARGPGTLVLCEGWHPGWRGAVDGKATPLLAAHHAFIGLTLERPGPARVELCFLPGSHRKGLWFAGAGLLGLALLALWAALGQRRA